MPALRALSTPTDHVFDSGSGGGWSWLQEHLGSDYHVRWSAAGLRWTKQRHGSRPAGVRQGAGMHAFTHGYVCVAALSAHAFLHQRKWGGGEGLICMTFYYVYAALHFFLSARACGCVGCSNMRCWQRRAVF